MLRKWRILFGFAGLISLILSACSGAITPTITPLATNITGTLRPYPSGTPTALRSPTAQPTPTPSPTFTLTPTPIYYDTRDGDDMFGIAFWYNISLESLLTANPSVNPRAMGPGTRLLIPVTPMPQPTSAATVEATATSAPSSLNWEEPDCYRDAAGGLWCFMLVENRQESALENVKGMFSLDGGEQVRQEVAYMPLNLLPAGRSLPLVAYFQPPIPRNYSVSGTVDYFLPVMIEDDRYLAVEINSQSVTYRDDDEIASIEGEVSIPVGQRGLDYLWVHATAYNTEGDVVGVRRWEADPTPEAGEVFPFAFEVYSMAGGIDHISILVEAHQTSEAEE